MDILSQALVETISPDYRIYKFTEQNYKIVHFKSTAPRGAVIDREKHEHYDKKLDQSLSRARRVVLELALCNNWKYFCTFTIAESNYDRKDLNTWHKSFTQWLRDQRKKYIKQGFDFNIDFLLVPEKHQDGSWHMHGLFSDISPLLISFKDLAKRSSAPVPYYLQDSPFYNWPDYQKKFGFCSFGLIRDKEKTAHYVSKYITKSLATDCASVGLHTYYPSRGLIRPSLHGEVYGNVEELNKFLDRHYEFCDVGMTYVRNNLDWTFGLEYMDYSMLEAFKLPDQEVYIPDVDDYADCVQLALNDFV